MPGVRGSHTSEHGRGAGAAVKRCQMKTPARCAGVFDTETNHACRVRQSRTYQSNLLSVAAAVRAIATSPTAAVGAILEFEAHAHRVIAFDGHALAGHAFAFDSRHHR